MCEKLALTEDTLTKIVSGIASKVSSKYATKSVATQSSAGLMSASDKKKLDGIDDNATATSGTLTGVSVNGTSVATSGVANITSVPASILTGSIPSAVTATTQSASDNSTKIATTAYVTNAINTINASNSSSSNHYTSKNVVGTTTATTNTTTALTNGNVYLNGVDNGTVTSTHKISGTGGATVTTDTSGNIIINAPSTPSVVTQSANGLMSAADKKIIDSSGKYATCATACSDVAKVVTLSNFVLQAGSHLYVKFTDTTTTKPTTGDITLNVNGTGAKNVYVSQAFSSFWKTTYSHALFFYNNQVHEFMYDGTQWVMFIGRDNNTTYSNLSLGQGYGTCTTNATAEVVTLASYPVFSSTIVGGIVSVKFTYAVPASATMNINSRGAKPIYFRGAAITAGIIDAGDIATFMYDGTNFILLAVDSSAYVTSLTSTQIQTIVDNAFA
jgi:hypothetical protein